MHRLLTPAATFVIIHFFFLFFFQTFHLPLALAATMLEVQERNMKIVTTNYVQFGQIGFHTMTINVAHLVGEERLKKYHIAYARMK